MERLRRILDLHFDPELGSRYWIGRERELGWSVRDSIRCEADLSRLGPMDLSALSERPVEDFIPKRFHRDRPLVIGETGGAMGTPKTTAYFEDEFVSIFVTPFLEEAEKTHFPTQGHWLFIGPTGPHLIGKAARAIARETSGSDGFSVDFDPRWYRKLAPESFARKRYMEHLLDQSLRIVRQNEITRIFTTPAVLESLAERMGQEARNRIGGVYLGGMPVGREDLETFHRAFERAAVVSGYGNTLFGVCHNRPTRSDSKDGGISYYPPSDRMIVKLVEIEEDREPTERLDSIVPYGERGQVVFHRLDESCFLPNVMERDTEIRISPADAGNPDGIRDPQPLQGRTFKVEQGIY